MRCRKRVLSVVLMLLIGFLLPAGVFAASGKKIRLSVEKERLTVYSGKTEVLSAATNGKAKFSFRSSNQSVVFVNRKGVIKGKHPGTAKITVTATPYSKRFTAARKIISVTVLPKKPAVAAEQNGGFINVSAKAVSYAEKYQFQYSADRDFKKHVTKTVQIPKIRFKASEKKTYYVRARAFAAKQYSGWSKIIKIMPASDKPCLSYSWQNSKAVIHALGGMEGYTLVNSREAFLEHYQKGNRVFEVDLQKTSDGVWVCRHDWVNPRGQWEDDGMTHVMSSEEFLKNPIYGHYTPMTWKDFLLLLKEYPDAFVMLDTKKYTNIDYEQVYRDYHELVQTATEADVTEVLQQLIPQIYSERMYTVVKSCYAFSSYVFPLMDDFTTADYRRIAAFCRTNRIPAAAISYKKWNQEIQKIFDAEGISMYVFRINNLEKARRYLSRGVAGVFVDFIADSELS